MVNDVADQKANRGDQGRDHAYHMAAPSAASDQEPAHRNEDGTQEIEGGIQGRQIGHGHDQVLHRYTVISGKPSNDLTIVTFVTLVTL